MRKYLLGGNTPKGFYSYYDSLIRRRQANRIYIIKGGPGTGKSTLMKKVAKWAEENGYCVDYIHCSSDPDSLDGLVIPEMKVAMVDGTSPHVVDPTVPGAVDKIINMGDCWNQEKMKSSKADIMQINSQIAGKYELAYEHLKAAGVLHDTIRKVQGRIIDKKRIMKMANEIIYSEIKGVSEKGRGFKRKLFASAYGPGGYISYADTFPCESKYILNGMGGEIITQRVADKFEEYGYDTELFYNPLSPDREILHIFVPELEVGIFTGDALNSVSSSKAMVLDLNRAADRYLMDEYVQEMDNCRRAMSRQTEEACEIIMSAKTLHDKLESLYIPNMDFAKAGKMTEEIIEELEKIK